MSSEQYSELAKSIVNDPEILNDLPDDQIAGLKNYLSPSAKAAEANKYAVMCIINQQEKYQKYFAMTAAVGFLFRAAAEYTPDWANKSTLSGAERKKLSEERNQFKKMLSSVFQYDEKKHSRPEGSQPPVVIPKEGKKDLPSRPKIPDEDLFLQIYQGGVAVKEATKGVISAISDCSEENLSQEDLIAILNKKYAAIDQTLSAVSSWCDFQSRAQTSACCITTPADLFGGFSRYIDQNYEELRKKTLQKYSAPSDIDDVVIFYDCFPDEETAKAYCASHQDDLKYGAVVVQNKGVTVLGPFKENRDRINFYNKNTSLLEGMMKQAEADARLGNDMMKKRTRAKKMQNVREVGPDDPSMREYFDSMNVAKKLGAENILSAEEQRKVYEAEQAKSAAETPDDSIQSKIWFDQFDADGERVLKSKTFYTKAEAPLHMQESSEFTKKYQP